MANNTSRISGVGSYLPRNIITNDDLAQWVDTNDEWISARTGIKQRHLIADDQSTADLAFEAATVALDDAKLSPNDLDLIIVATTTPDHIFPSVASQLQHRLGCRSIAAFDLQAVCAGFIYALSTAHNFIMAGQSNHVLVVGAEAMSRILDWNDRSTCVLFGDGAGAFVMSASDEAGVESVHLHSDGQYKEMLWVPDGPGGLTPSEPCPDTQQVDHEQVSQDDHVQTSRDQESRDNVIRMRGNDVFKIAVPALSRSVEETLAHNGLTADDIDWLVPHQANKRILSAVAKRLSFSEDKVIVTVDQHANTSSASVPLAFAQGVRDGRIKRGDRCILEAFGGGFVWGSALVTY